MTTTTNESSLETDRDGRDAADSKRLGFPALLEQELWSRVANAHRAANLRLHEHLLRQLPAVTNESTAWAIAALRASVAHELDRLASLVNNSEPSFAANATARRLASLDDELPQLSGVGDVGYVMSSFHESTGADGSQLVPVTNTSFDEDNWNTHGERKADYVTGMMSFQLQRTRSTLNEEFRVAQDKMQSISFAVETEMQDQIATIVADLRKLTEQYERGGIDSKAGERGLGTTFLSEPPASHALHCLPKSPTTVWTTSRAPTIRSPPSSLLWWWKLWWPSHPTWSNATDEQNVTVGDDNSTSSEGDTGIMSFLMNGAASDPQRTLVWYAIKGESTRLAFVALELAAGIFTDSLMAMPQVDARRVAAKRSIVRDNSLVLPSLHPTVHLTASCAHSLSLSLQASLWDIVTCRCTVASLVLALATHGREFARAAFRIFVVGIVSLMATVILMEMKSNHLEICPEYRRGLHLDDDVAVNASTPPAERTWFMMKALPFLDLISHEQYNTIRLAEELDKHATAMFGALESRVDAVWSEQVGEMRIFRPVRCQRLLTLTRV